MRKHSTLATGLLALALVLALAGPVSAQFYGVGGRPPGSYGYYGGGYPYGGLYGGGLYGNGLYGSGLYGGYPYGGAYGSGLYGSGLYGSGLYGSGLYGSGLYGGYPYGVNGFTGPYGAYGAGAYPGIGLYNNYYGGYGGYPYGGAVSPYGFGGYPSDYGGYYGGSGYSSMYPSGGIALSNKLDNVSAGITSSVWVKVPTADAEVWVNGVKTKTTGSDREFVTPKLTPGKKYKYQVKVLWQENGKEQSREETVSFLPGQNVNLDLATPGADEKKPGKKIEKDGA